MTFDCIIKCTIIHMIIEQLWGKTLRICWKHITYSFDPQTIVWVRHGMLHHETELDLTNYFEAVMTVTLVMCLTRSYRQFNLCRWQ